MNLYQSAVSLLNKMPSLPERIPSRDSKNFFDMIVEFWPIIAVFGVFLLGYGGLQNKISDLQIKETQNEAAVVNANQNYSEVAGNIQGINAKLDIIIKHDGL